MPERQPLTLRAIGLMSGTSMDGIDVALVETDGEAVLRTGPGHTRPYAGTERDTLRAALAEAVALESRTARPGVLARAEALVTRAHVEAVQAFMAAQGLRPSDIDVIGFHGQTVLHRPERRLTVQIGDGAALAEALGIAVVHDMRAADVAAGGQGAPLVPAYHRALALATLPPSADTVAVLNLGGVGNVTALDGAADPLAFDTGPGNALIDDLVQARTGRSMDEDGSLARAGRVDEAALARLMDHPYFAVPPPKSLDRNAFSAEPVSGLSTEDAAATLVAFTAESVARAAGWLVRRPALWVVCGGGARNPALLDALRERLGAEVRTGGSLGWDGDLVEAQAFAYLAVRSLRGLPLTFPTTTGIQRPLMGGVLSQPGRERRRA